MRRNKTAILSFCLNEKLISKCMPLVAHSYIEPHLKAKVGRFECEYDSDKISSVNEKDISEMLKRKLRVKKVFFKYSCTYREKLAMKPCNTGFFG